MHDASSTNEPGTNEPGGEETGALGKSTRTHEPPLPRNVRLLGWASLINDLASEMIYPLMPQFLIGVLGGNRFHLGIIEGVADSAGSLIKLASGAWSDRSGRRKRLVVFGYSLAAVARPLIGLAMAPWHLFAARAADRIGKGIRTSPRDALIADSTPAPLHGRAFGFHRAMDHLGAAIGPLLASAVLLALPGHLRWVFLITLVPGLVVVGLLFFGLRERPAAIAAEPLAEEPAPPESKQHPLDSNYVLYLLALVVFTLGNSSDAFLLVRASELGVPTWMLPLLWCVFHVVKSGGNLLAGRAVDRFGPRPLILLSWSAYALVYLAFGLSTEAWEIWAIFLVYGLVSAMTEPSEKTLVIRLVGVKCKGLAFGWFHFATGIAALPSSLLFGWIYENVGPLAAFGWGSGMALLGAGMMLGVRANAATGD